MARELTDKQKRVLSTLEAYWSTHQVPPSISDLAKQLGINKATAYEHLLALKKKGYLIHQARAGRTWRPAQQNKFGSCSHQAIALLNGISFSDPLLAPTNIEKYVFGDHEKNDKLFAIRMVGDSMIKVHIKHNDLVVAEQDREVGPKDIVVAIIDSKEAYVRRLEKRLDKMILHAENDLFNPMELSPHRVLIAGKVIEVRRTIE